MAGDDEIQEHSVAKLSVIFLSTGNYIRLKYSEAAPSSSVTIIHPKPQTEQWLPVRHPASVCSKGD